MAVVRKKQDDKYLLALRELVTSGAGNRQCFDCGQKGPTYVNMTIGSFVCTRCSGVLRGLTPPHRVKSISMATFTQDEIDFLKAHGNELCTKTWLGLWDPKRAPQQQDQRELMINKYEHKRYYLEPASPLKSLPNMKSATVAATASTAATNGQHNGYSSSNGYASIHLTPPAAQRTAANGLHKAQQSTSTAISRPQHHHHHQQQQNGHQDAFNMNISSNTLAALSGLTSLNSAGSTSTGALSDTSSCASNGFAGDADFVADFGTANIFDANSMNSTGSPAVSSASSISSTNGYARVQPLRAAHLHQQQMQQQQQQQQQHHQTLNGNGTENFADFEHAPIYNAAAMNHSTYNCNSASNLRNVLPVKNSTYNANSSYHNYSESIHNFDGPFDDGKNCSNGSGNINQQQFAHRFESDFVPQLRPLPQQQQQQQQQHSKELFKLAQQTAACNDHNFVPEAWSAWQPDEDWFNAHDRQQQQQQQNSTICVMPAVTTGSYSMAATTTAICANMPQPTLSPSNPFLPHILAEAATADSSSLFCSCLHSLPPATETAASEAAATATATATATVTATAEWNTTKLCNENLFNNNYLASCTPLQNGNMQQHTPKTQAGNAPSEDRYAALKDLDEQLREMKASELVTAEVAAPNNSTDAFGLAAHNNNNNNSNNNHANPFKAQQQQQQLALGASSAMLINGSSHHNNNNNHVVNPFQAHAAAQQNLYGQLTLIPNGYGSSPQQHQQQPAPLQLLQPMSATPPQQQSNFYSYHGNGFAMSPGLPNGCGFGSMQPNPVISVGAAMGLNAGAYNNPFAASGAINSNNPFL